LNACLICDLVRKGKLKVEREQYDDDLFEIDGHNMLYDIWKLLKCHCFLKGSNEWTRRRFL